MQILLRKVIYSMLLIPVTIVTLDAQNDRPVRSQDPGPFTPHTKTETVAGSINEVTIPGGEYVMGDHNGHYDPGHPNDEVPLHTVRIDSLLMSTTETTNRECMMFLNELLSQGMVEVRNNKVYRTGDTLVLFYTHQFEPWYSIGFNGTEFSVADFRADHPAVGVMWFGAALYCNWLSQQNGLQECYDPESWSCDFSKNGYRLPTEAEWEYAGRGGHTNPYLKYPNGNSVDILQANLPNSGDPYETGSYPFTTPVGFYDGTLKQKSEYNWPGSATTYQTNDGKNGYGLYDIQGNVWEFLNDWYTQNYYSESPYNNPAGPAMGSLMPDGKPYRGMRGGNWYNGIDSNGVNDGHSRVSNRDPSYYRGPQDPNHPWYHVGFRVARNYSVETGLNEPGGVEPGGFILRPNYPNPVTGRTTIKFFVAEMMRVTITLSSLLDQPVITLVNDLKSPGWHTVVWDGSLVAGGIYFLSGSDGKHRHTYKMAVVK